MKPVKRRVGATACAFTMGACLGLLNGSSRAAEPITATLDSAAEAEDRAEPKAALELYHRAAEDYPTDRLARRARARIAWLEARREGNLVPLAAWLRMRSRSRTALTEEDLATFTVDSLEFPPGLVRREAAQFIADTWLSHFERPREAAAAYARWSQEPGLDDAERQLAESGLALARSRLGDPGAALERLRRNGLGGRAEARFLRAERVAKWGGAISIAVLVSYAAALGMLLLRARRAFRFPENSRLLLGIAAFTLGLPIVFVALYDAQFVRAFAPTMGALALVLLVNWLVAEATEPSPSTAARLRWASVGAVVSAAFLATSHTGMLTEFLMAAWEPR